MFCECSTSIHLYVALVFFCAYFQISLSSCVFLVYYIVSPFKRVGSVLIIFFCKLLQNTRNFFFRRCILVLCKKKLEEKICYYTYLLPRKNY